jgi:hypothetical protein
LLNFAGLSKIKTVQYGGSFMLSWLSNSVRTPTAKLVGFFCLVKNRIRTLVPWQKTVSLGQRGFALTGSLQTGSLSVVEQWRLFLGAKTYQNYRRQAVAAGAVQALSGVPIALPLLLILGLSPGVAMIVLAIPLLGPAGQLLVPRLLWLTRGNFRRVTLVFIGLGETIGLWVAPVLLLGALGFVSLNLVIFVIIFFCLVNGLLSGPGYGNLSLWYRIVLDEKERRFVAPRCTGVNMATAAILLFLAAILLDPVTHFLATALANPYANYFLLPFALLYFLGGLAGLGEILILRQFVRPGRVLPQARATFVFHPSAPVQSFLRVVAFASFGMGLAPYLSLFAIAILHTSAGFAIFLAAVSSGASILASTIAAAILSHHSSSRLLRLSFFVVAAGYGVVILARPNIIEAPNFLILGTLLVAAGGAISRLALNERFIRLIGDADPLAFSARFLSTASVGQTLGQAAAGFILLAAPEIWLVYSGVFFSSALIRVIAGWRLPVSASWRSPGLVADELQANIDSHRA